jgi:hypothetical protein
VTGDCFVGSLLQTKFQLRHYLVTTPRNDEVKIRLCFVKTQPIYKLNVLTSGGDE